MTTAEQPKEEPQRIIGRWTIGPTLGKGGYSWVKRGQDIKTGKIVALKFMEKADVSWVKEQAKQVETEIEALKNIRHQNVMKLYAYNLNAQYPLAPNVADDVGHTSVAAQEAQSNKDAEQKFIDTILLVLEYAPGGELFDILYYTSALKENVARTYFRQIISGLEACHNANVVHRDLKPQNLLLDAKYNLKITDFGLSKIITSDADAIMKTYYVGTRGYQAPELLENKQYDLKCDIFSAGVILFILMAGYPPFEQASKTDKWFKPLTKGNVDKFWRAHHKSQIAQLDTVKDLLTQMLSYDPKKRIDLNAIKAHAWFNGEVLKQKDLVAEIRDRHRKAEKKRRADVRKQSDLAQSLNPNKPIPGIEKAVLKNFPSELTEGLFGDYTFVNNDKPWYDVYNLIEEAITGTKYQGGANFDFEKGILHCTMSVLTAGAAAVQTQQDDSKEKEMQTAATQKKIEFDVIVYRSRIWAQKMEQASKELAAEKLEEVLVVRVIRTMGDSLTYNQIMKDFMLGYCASIIKGLPKWARNAEKEENGGDEAAVAIDQTDAAEDEYEKVLANDSNIFQAVAAN
eukprot:CAMPEP_0202687676 /NCGR_PEP_ID=MMETSP1385-20130828/3334_1 /ASSEMBLY_ACC=CAM_ASM_000861 /TAXON_ID=933848 /ORGANISM="Elphidium margaritaceum" /LENGTH=569 /DNA_ID=CAMNT_0049342511 /DNA_START=106 /DNA_END=1815 /DNA_ORIENTATION=+